MGAGFSDQFECCISRDKEQKVPPRKTQLILTCDAVKAALATTPRSDDCAQDDKAVNPVLQTETTAEGSWENASMLTLSVASRSQSMEDVTCPCETTSVDANAISLGTSQVREVGDCDAWTTPEVLRHCNSLTCWYNNLESSSCNNDISASGQDVNQQAKANRSLSNWYTGNIGAEVASLPPTNPIGLPILEQAPCHYYILSSFVDESAVSN